MNWEKYIRRDQILYLWMEAYQSKLEHKDLIEAIVETIKTQHGDNADTNVDPQRLTTICEQIQAGMLKQLDKAKKSTKNPTDFERTMWAKAKTRIPNLLFGAKDTARTDYSVLFGNLLNDIQNEATTQNKKDQHGPGFEE